MPSQVNTWGFYLLMWNYSSISPFSSGSGEEHLYVVAPMATKAANVPQLIPHSSKEGW